MKSGEGRRILHPWTMSPSPQFNAPEQNHPYSSMHSQHCIALRFCDKWWSFRASTETSFNRHWDTSIHHHSSIDGNPKTDYTHHKNDLLESSDSDSVSDLCRTFLQEVFDTLITFPNWNTTTTADWSWPPKCPGFVVVTCLFFCWYAELLNNHLVVCVSAGLGTVPSQLLIQPSYGTLLLTARITQECPRPRERYAKLLQWGSSQSRRWQVATDDKTRCTNWLLCNYRNERIFALLATRQRVDVWIELLLIGERPLHRTAIMRIPLDTPFWVQEMQQTINLSNKYCRNHFVTPCGGLLIPCPPHHLVIDLIN